MKNVASFILTIFVLFIACKKDNEGDKNTQGISTSPPPQLVFKFKFDSTQIRLDNLGQPSIIPAGHSAQSPVFNKMSTHYIELTPTALTAVGSGTVLYRAAETSIGGSLAIDFDSSTAVNEGQVCYSIPLSKVTPGTYSYLRVSLAYQNYNIKAMVSGYAITGTLASFIGFNTYIRNYKIKDSSITVNANKLQGYWGFETNVLGTKYVSTGQSAGATTVPNPIASTSPIPSGSCLVTGAFTTPLKITGSETKDVTVVISLSTNKSFEWKDANTNGVYEPAAGDTVTDMGVRGLLPIVQ